MGRKRTPDILGDVLSEPEAPADGRKAKLEPVKPPKTKATYYLEPDIIAALDAGWLALRSLADDDARTRVSKSAIVDAALRIALAELQEKGEGSQLASMLV